MRLSGSSWSFSRNKRDITNADNSTNSINPYNSKVFHEPTLSEDEREYEIRYRGSPLKRLKRKMSTLSKKSSFESFSERVTRKPSLRLLVRKLSAWSVKGLDSTNLVNNEYHTNEFQQTTLPRKSSVRFSNNWDTEITQPKKVRFNVKKSRSWLNLDTNTIPRRASSGTCQSNSNIQDSKTSKSRIKFHSDILKQNKYFDFAKYQTYLNSEKYQPSKCMFDSIGESLSSMNRNSTSTRSFLKNTRAKPTKLNYLSHFDPDEDDWNNLHLYILRGYKQWEEVEQRYNDMIEKPQVNTVSDENVDPDSCQDEPDIVISERVENGELANNLYGKPNKKSQALLELHRRNKWETR